MKEKTICLNMIVKNEKTVIKRCLESVKNLIDYWVIVDTGSTDGTQDIIKDYLKGIPGELHEQPWVDFGHNRNAALSLAKNKADYTLFIDADDQLVLEEQFILPKLEADGYAINQREACPAGYIEHAVIFMIRNDPDYKWEGVIHEYLVTETEKKMPLLSHAHIEYLHDGHRSQDPKKTLKDIAVLKKAVKDHPTNGRYPFYLARTCWVSKLYREALKYFEITAKTEKDPQTLYYSLLFKGLCQKNLNYAPAVFLKSFSDAHIYRPTRAEALYEIARHYTDTQNYFLGATLAKRTAEIPMSTDNLFVEPWIYEWGGRLLFFICSKELGKIDEALSSLDILLSSPKLPEKIRKDFKLDQEYHHLTQSTSKMENELSFSKII